MPRQRSKKISSSRVAEEKTARKEVWDSEPEYSDNASLDISEKDEDEEELERLVLGDGATFKVQLGMDMDLDKEDLEGNGREEDLEAEVGLENVDDADVSTPPYFA
jgi:U3 small nucleolar RNA-associated protein 18